ncbi:glutamine synthetase guanido kinase [Lentinula edodes]|uniref:Glutamine synthetase n=1 Tax=Lentinula edodes TaxID=5353 RepID=A0A1Q3E1C3_LENED|nr:glutamine synthetase guanido kinase [Lentinula edodes]
MDFTHGITHTPATVKASSKAITLAHIKASTELKYVRLYWVDLSNTRRCRVIPRESFLQLMESNRPGVNVGQVALGLVYLTIAEGFHPIGEYLYVPDLSSLRILHGVGKSPIFGILGKFKNKSPEGKKSGVEVEMCPRTALSRIIRTNQVFCRILEAEIIEEIADSLQASGITVELFHPEAAPGQYEVATGPLPPLEAADALVYTREIIVNVAAKHGVHATFAPRPFMYSAGTSTHAHISVHDIANRPEFRKAPGELSLLEKAFLAGVLSHLPAIAAITLPIPASYKRAVDGAWSGGTRYECRFIDATANPHLALAAVLGSALAEMGAVNDGSGDVQLEVQDAGTKPAAVMTEEERKTHGITKRMPASSGEARSYLRGDGQLCEVLGKELIEAFLSVNKTLEDALMQDQFEDEQVTRLVEFY